MTKLSIIIPVYNAEKYLEETIQSLIIEKSKDIEFLFINDGSKDKSINILKKYKKVDKRIKVFTKENGGVSSARNFGMQKANSDYIMFMDSDDLLDSNYYQIVSSDIQKESKKKNNKYDWIIYTKNYDNRKFDNTNLIEGIYNLDFYYNRLNLRTVWSKLYRKDFLKKNTLEFTKILNGSEDMWFNTCVLNCNAKVKISDQHIYDYRIIRDSLSSKIDINQQLAYRNLLINFDTNLVKNLNYLIERSDLYGIFGATCRIARNKSHNKVKELKELANTEWARASLKTLDKHKLPFFVKFELLLVKIKFYRTLFILLFIWRIFKKKEYFIKI